MNLRTIRRKHAMTQGEMAKVLGISQSLLSKIEHGWREPSDALQSKINDFCATLSDQSDLSDAEARAYILHCESIPHGLKALAADDGLVESLRITSTEWIDLKNCRLSFQPTKSGYLQLLTTIRGIYKCN